MTLERERKFLIKKGESLPIEEMVFIQQGYIHCDENSQLRVRIITEVINSNTNEFGDTLECFITFKTHINDTDKEEYEIPIDQSKAVKIWNACDSFIEKYRAKVGRWEVDRYLSKNKEINDLVVAEIEYSDDNPFPEELPRWVGEEVTGIKKYSNIYLAGINTLREYTD